MRSSGFDLKGDVLEPALEYIVRFLFGGVQTEVTTATVKWQLDLPDEALHEATCAAAPHHAGGRLRAARAGDDRGGAALLARRLADGGAGGGGVLRLRRGRSGRRSAIVAWPWFFDSAILLVDSLTHALISAPSVQDDLERDVRRRRRRLADRRPGRRCSPAIVIVVAGTLMMLGLFAASRSCFRRRLAVHARRGAAADRAGTVPRPPRGCLGSPSAPSATLLPWPVIWALCFATFAAVFNDVVTFRGDGGVLDKALIKPLTGVAMLYLCVKLPLLATKASMFGVGEGGLIATAGKYVAVQQIARTATGAIGGARQGLGGGGAPDKLDALGNVAGSERNGRLATVAAGAATGGAATAAGAAGNGAAAGIGARVARSAFRTNGKGSGAPPPPPTFGSALTKGESADAARMTADAKRLPADRVPGPTAVAHAMGGLDEAGRARIANAAARDDVAAVAFNNAARAESLQAAAERGGERDTATVHGAQAAVYRTIGTAAVHDRHAAAAGIAAGLAGPGARLAPPAPPTADPAGNEQAPMIAVGTPSPTLPSVELKAGPAPDPTTATAIPPRDVSTSPPPASPPNGGVTPKPDASDDDGLYDSPFNP